MKITNVLEYLHANPEGSFLHLANFNEHNFGTCSITGVSPGWEMHPDTDEFFYVIEGYLDIVLLRETKESHRATSGSAFVVPKGIWHKPGAPEGAKFIHFTPGQSLYSEKEDPRIVDAS